MLDFSYGFRPGDFCITPLRYTIVLGDVFFLNLVFQEKTNQNNTVRSNSIVSAKTNSLIRPVVMIICPLMSTKQSFVIACLTTNYEPAEKGHIYDADKRDPTTKSDREIIFEERKKVTTKYLKLQKNETGSTFNVWTMKQQIHYQALTPLGSHKLTESTYYKIRSFTLRLVPN